MIERDYLPDRGKDSGGNKFTGPMRKTSTTVEEPFMTTTQTGKEDYGPDPYAPTPPAAGFDSPWTGQGNMNTPPEWSGASNAYWEMIRNMGNPVDTSGIFEAMGPVAERYLREQGAQLSEDFGFGGLRWSTPLQNSLIREQGRMTENMTLAQVMAEIQAKESGMGRVPGAISGLAGMGDRYWNAPFQASNNMLQQSALYQQMGQSQIDSDYRNTMNPWLMELWKSLSDPTNTLPMYPPSGAANFLGGAIPGGDWMKGMGNWWDKLFGGGGSYVPPANDMSGVLDQAPSNLDSYGYGGPY